MHRINWVIANSTMRCAFRIANSRLAVRGNSAAQLLAVPPQLFRRFGNGRRRIGSQRHPCHRRRRRDGIVAHSRQGWLVVYGCEVDAFGGVLLWQDNDTAAPDSRGTTPTSRAIALSAAASSAAWLISSTLLLRPEGSLPAGVVERLALDQGNELLGLHVAQGRQPRHENLRP